ncbi:MAG: cellulase family glycosylhydrolase [Oscillospiraceae bacterium]|nr:cellulase family glycosylhydrolase [Oscillospiraceae bacterium]
MLKQKLKKLIALSGAFVIGAMSLFTSMPAAAGEVVGTDINNCDYVYTVNQSIQTSSNGDEYILSISDIPASASIEEILVQVSGGSQTQVAIGFSVDESVGLEDNWYKDSVTSYTSSFTASYNVSDISANYDHTSSALYVQYWWGTNSTITIEKVGVNVEGGNSGVSDFTSVKGDANADGALNCADIYQLNSYILRKTDACNEAAELNSDDKFSCVDTLILKRLVLGIYNPSSGNEDIRDITGFELMADMKIGWNLGNTLDAHADYGVTLGVSQAETYWGNPVTTKAMIDAIKNAGFNTVRIPTTYMNHTGSAPNYTIDEAWLNRVQEVVDYVIANDMYCIINIHHENDWLKPKYANQSECEARLEKLWTQIANRFKEYDDHLIFEVMNEPRLVGDPTEWNGGTSEARQVINSYNQVCVDTIRATGGNNAERWLMVPTYAASTVSSVLNEFVLPSDPADKIMVSIHAYTPYDFALNTTGTSSFTDYYSIDSLFQTLNSKFISQGVPVVIGEFGAVNKNNDSQRETWAAYYISKASSYGIPCVWWDNGLVSGEGELFGLLNRSTCQMYYSGIVNAMMGALN